MQGLRSEPNGFDLDVKHEEDSIAENSASQAEETPGESPAEVTEEHPPAPDSSHEVSEEVPAPDTSDSWGFTSTRKKGRKVKRPSYDWN
jgi:hypothetical protein